MTGKPTISLDLSYRPDLDGLRAIAVLSVVTFHAFPEMFPGGFIGVDIFFVISGYLISEIIFTNIENNTFSFADFYKRRIRRIFPSLAIMMFAGFIVGWFSLLEGEYRQLGKHIAGGATFVSNFVLWNESGYFDNTAEMKPMLHLWSLAIEEQFYIFWPLILTFFRKKKWSFFHATAMIAALSFSANLYFTNHNPATAFYWPISRFWELMAGGALAYISLYQPDFIERFRNLQSLFGFFLIGSGLTIINKHRLFPNWWALFPTIGTFLMISAGCTSWLNKYVLSNKLLVWIGLISYPLYLWHWMLLSFLRIIDSSVSSKKLLVASFISFLLSWATYVYIEKPIRKNKKSTQTITALIISMMILFLAGMALNLELWHPHREVTTINHDPNTGFDGGFGESPIKHNCREISKKLIDLHARCVLDSRHGIRYAIIGDSKARALITGLIRTSTDKGRWILIGGNATRGAPVPVLSDNDIYKKHQELAAISLEFLASNDNIDIVVFAIAARTLFNLNTDYEINDLPSSPYYKAAYDGLLRATKQITEKGKKVVLLVDNPTLPHPQHCMERITSLRIINDILSLKQKNKKCIVKLDEYYRLSDQYNKLLVSIRDTNPQKIFVFDTIPYLCDMHKRECSTFKGDRFLYGNTDHISDFAAGLIGQGLNDFLAKIE